MAMIDRWIALDVETSGLSPTRHEIVEIAAVPFDLNGMRTGDSLHLTRADLRAPSRSPTHRGLTELLRTIGDDSILIAHNAAFDLAFLAEAFCRAQVRPFSVRAYCTLRLARALLPDVPRYDLGSLRDTLGLPAEKSHVALADARTVAALFTALVRSAGCADAAKLRALHGPLLQVRRRSTATGSQGAHGSANSPGASYGQHREPSPQRSAAHATGG